MKFARKRSFKKIIIFFDNVRVHTSKKFKEFLKKNKDFIKVYPLSKYSPNLNEVEVKVNKQIKRDVCSNWFHGDTCALKKNLRKYLNYYVKNLVE